MNTAPIGHVRNRSAATIADPKILLPAIGEAIIKLDPRKMIRNPVMFVVEVVAALTTFLFVRDLIEGRGGIGFAFQINLWLWFTVLFANFAEAVAEGRGKAQAASLRKTQTDLMAKRLADQKAKIWSNVSAQLLERGDLVELEIEGIGVLRNTVA